MPLKIELEDLSDDFLYSFLDKSGSLQEKIRVDLGKEPSVMDVARYIREDYETITIRGVHAVIERRMPL